MSLFSVLLYFLQRKKILFGIPLCAGLLGFGLAWILPPSYTSDIRLRVDDSNESSLSSLVSASAGKSLGGFASFLSSSVQLTPSDLYMEILSGRDVKIAVIKRFQLDTLYKKKSMELLIKALSRDLTTEMDETGIVSCSFEAKNKVLARDILRYATQLASARYTELQRERLKYSLQYLNESSRQMTDSIASTGKELVVFYRTNNLLNLKAQMELTISALAGYEEEINNYKLSESNQLAGSAASEELRRKRHLLETEFEKLRGRFTDQYRPSNKSVYVNSDWAVSKLLFQEGLEAKLKRQMAILEVVSTQIAMTEAEFIKSQPVIQVLQDAYLPDWKSRPKRAKWALGTMVLAGAFVCILLLLQGIWLSAIQGSETIRGKLVLVVESLRS